MKEPKAKTKKYTYFIGIDVSKNELDYAVMRGSVLLFHEERKNEPADIYDFLKKLKELPRFTLKSALFCMEHTGIYCNHLLNVLQKLNAFVVLENPMQIKHASGVFRAKDDKTDAIKIAAYAQRNTPDLNLWNPRRHEVLKLAILFSLRNRYLATSVALNSPVKEERIFFIEDFQNLCRALSRESLIAVKTDLTRIEAKIDELVRADERLDRLMRVITSVTGIGRITALQIIISTNEFIDISDPKKFACYAGVAPFKRESGKMIKREIISHFSNKKMKSLLHMCVISALRYSEELKVYFKRKTEVDRKSGRLVMNAIRNKLISRVFACVREDRMYTDTYEIKKKYNRQTEQNAVV